MLQAYFRWLTVSALLLLAGSCAAPASRGDAEAAEREHEEQQGPVLSTAAKITGSTFLTNIREIGILSFAGRVTCMAIDKTDSNHLIAGAATGGLWTSSNRGKTWAPIDDQLPSLNIRSLTQNPIQTNIYYASTFTNMLAGASPSSYRPDIYKSTDGGRSFQLLPATAGTFSQVIKVVCSPLNTATLYALSDNFGTARGLYRSSDHGASFTQVFPIVSTNVSDLEVLPDGSVLVSAGSQVWRSPNGNTGTFVAASGLSGANTFSNIDLAFCQSQPANVWGISTGGNSGVGVFRSTDGGQNWSFVQSLTSGVFTRAIGVKPNDPGFVFAGSVALYLTRNAGSSFAFYGVGGVDWWSVNFDPSNADRVFMTFDQGIALVGLNPFNPNNNSAYVKRDSLLNCAQIYAGDYFPVGDKVIIGLQDLSTEITYPGGTYGLGAGGDGGYSYYHKQDTTIAYGCRQNGDIFKKTKAHIAFPNPGFTQPVSILNQLDANADGNVDEGAYFIQPFWVNSADGEQLYYPTKRRLWRSLNGGTSWQPVSSYYDLSAPASGEIFMEGNGKINPVIYWSVRDTLWIKPSARTASAGGEIKVKLPGNVRFVRVDPSNDSIVYVTSYSATTGPRIHRSSNLFKPGLTWTDLSGDFPPNIAVRCIEVNPQNKSQLVVGSSSGLFASADGGVHWVKEIQFPNVNILRSIIRPSDKRLFIFTYGRGAWSASFPATSNIAAVPGTSTDLPVWPNPTQGMLQVAVGEGHPSRSLKVWSADGRLKKTISTAGLNRLPVDMTELPAGIYIVGLYEGGKRLSAARVVKY